MSAQMYDVAFEKAHVYNISQVKSSECIFFYLLMQAREPECQVHSGIVQVFHLVHVESTHWNLRRAPSFVSLWKQYIDQ